LYNGKKLATDEIMVCIFKY